MAQAQPKKFLSAAEVSQRWDGAVSTGTLANWRTQKKGPPYQKLGSKVRYPIVQLEAWEHANLVAANDNEPTVDTEDIKP
ncbi:helix-turn-helix domain-containing transcriptional regulator [Burkholderia phage Mica]|uniref:Helix-turn-helix domain-containing transcriptional regulator n=1 Tax=Burkholderia phage Mica TaxID=2767579 RepID=A0A873WF11_9CAUD|nr:helix-turn-helix domain-containing transcriptional regulator [Burkholderia phage Mica]QPB08648.1 helix-turn-helix domain-containing transcriptional regulator [Burkholderia phage Mica]